MLFPNYISSFSYLKSGLVTDAGYVRTYTLVFFNEFFGGWFPIGGVYANPYIFGESIREEFGRSVAVSCLRLYSFSPYFGSLNSDAYFFLIGASTDKHSSFFSDGSVLAVGSVDAVDGRKGR